MKETIVKMLQLAEDERNCDLIDLTGELLCELARTINAPSNWRSIGEELMWELPPDSWAKENLYRFGFWEEDDEQ